MTETTAHALSAPAFPLSDREMVVFVDGLLREDGIDPETGSGDLTTDGAIPPDLQAKGVVLAREPMVAAGLPLAHAVFRRLSDDLVLEVHAKDGERVAAGKPLFSLSGPARAILVGERAALNLVQHLSGIATLTARYAEAIADLPTVLLDTRKTIPGLRVLAKYATFCGGARNHRQGLADAIMIKDNHIAACGGIHPAVEALRQRGNRPIELECDTVSQVEEGLALGVDRLLLDNMPVTTLRQVVDLCGDRIFLEASGGVTLDTIRPIAETGVHFVSVGRLTQSAPAIDIGMDFTSE